MITFKDFLRWYNNKNVLPTLKAIQKVIDFYRAMGTDMLKLGCTLPNFASVFLFFLQKSTNHKFYPFFEGDKDVFEKIRKDVTDGPSIFFWKNRCRSTLYA